MSSRYSDSVKRVKARFPTIAKAQGGKVSPVANNKSIDPARNRAAREYTQRVVDEDFDGNVLRASKAFKISQSMLYDFLNNNRGAGLTVLEGVARYRRVSLEVVMGIAPDLSAGRPPPVELEAAIKGRGYLPETQAMLRLYASLRHEPQSEAEWSELGDGYERENKAARDRAELKGLRSRPRPEGPDGSPSTTKRIKT